MCHLLRLDQFAGPTPGDQLFNFILTNCEEDFLGRTSLTLFGLVRFFGLANLPFTFPISFAEEL